ncbi:MAG TPA: lysylphosphatidylglycerol synthase transmembrane domain-containing protein [Gemmataceae bacterium]|nr:lysylphosphatidylglycerol synthase transmembrane domain-containing protein [Gemmataceae bacterium]
MTKKLKLGVSAGLLAWLACRTDWAQVGQAFARLRVGLWLAAVGLYVLSQVVSGLRWQLLARPLGFRRRLGPFVAYYFIGMYFNLFLPTSVGGDVVRAWYLDGGSGRRVAAFLSVFVDRLSGLLVLLGLACVAVAVCPVSVPRWVVVSVWGTAGAAVVGLLALPLLTDWSRRFARARPLADGVRFYLGRPGLLLRSAALSLGVQAANVVLVWLVGEAIGAPVPGPYYWILVPMVTLLTLVPLSLNGMGLREWGMVLFLRPLGVGAGTALSLAFLWFCVFTVSSLLGAAVYLWGSFPRPEVQPDHGPLGDHSAQGRARQHPTAA